MVLRQPDGVEAGFVHGLDALERAVIDLLEGAVAAGPREELQDADFHCDCQ